MSLRYLDDQTILDRYIELKAKRDEINEELDEIRPQLAAAVSEEDGGEYQYGDNHFSVSTRTTWDFKHIDRIVNLEEELKFWKEKAKKNASKIGADPEETADVKKQSLVLTMKYKPQGTAIR